MTDEITLMKHNRIIDIKDFLCENFSIEIVIIQIGGWFEVIEKCADIMNREFGLKIHDNAGLRSYRCLRFPLGSLDKYDDLLNELNYSYCFVLETDRGDKLVSRKVEISNNKEILGLEFDHKIK
ncbi:MAG: hypothetical protein CFH08_01800 [Alphaproteobacteria bacterium MarineAlpha3_Bin7]|nr:MAG: hypothetical protein CFH08_01800 [Alphaproteobacteria bacterium MarineAlpha3_Bin7]